MFTVALIGVDGAGKTTICNMLRKSLPLRIKYIYMGVNIESSNIALPTSRLMMHLKRFNRRKKNKHNPDLESTLHFHEIQPKQRKSSKIRAVARLINRITEEFYRQVVAWLYQLRGHVILFDRHFLFDYALIDMESRRREIRLSDRLHRWFIKKVLPQPDLVIFLDAPLEVLFDRKGEWTYQHLQIRRNAFIHQGRKIKNFVQIDATQPVEKVYEEVSEKILKYYQFKISKNKSELSSTDCMEYSD